MTDDVRTRFTVENQGAVINAFNQIGAAGKKSAHEVEGAFSELRHEVSQLAGELVGLVALAEVVEKFKELGHEVTDTAAQFYKMQQSTGLTDKVLNALQDTAEKNGVAFESVSKSVGILTRNIGLAEQGSRKAAAGFSELGIRISDLKKLSPDQQFELINQKLIAIDDVSRRAAIGSQLMGRGFAEALPAFKSLAEEGVDEVTDAMRRLGVFIDQDTINALHAAKVASKDLEDELKGVATQFIAGLAPAASNAMGQLLKATEGDGVSGFKVLGEWVGNVIEAIVTGFRIAGEAIAAFAADATNAIHLADNLVTKAQLATLKVLPNALRPQNLKDGSPGLAAMQKEADSFGVQQAANAHNEIKNSLKDNVQAALMDYGTNPIAEPEKKKGDGKGGDGEGAAASVAAGKARLELITAQLEAQNEVYNAAAKLRIDQDKAAYEQGKMGLAAYFGDRADVIAQQGANEQRLLEARRAAIAAQPVDINDPAGALTKQAQLAKIDGDIQAKKLETESKLADLARDRATEEKRNNDAQASASQKLLTIEGKRAEAAKVALDAQLKALQAELAKSGASPAEVGTAIDTARTQGTAKIDYDQTRREADASMQTLQTRTRQVNDQVAGGNIFPVQAQQQVAALQQQALPALQAYADKMQQLAQQSGLPELVAQADQFSQSVKQVGTASDLAGQQMADLKRAGEDAFTNGLTQLFDNLGNKAESTGDKLKSFAAGVIQTLGRMAAQMLANKAMQWLFGTGDAPAAGGGIGGGIGGGLAAAAGGNSSGPGQGAVAGSAGSDLQGNVTKGLISWGLQYLPMLLAGGGQIKGPGTGTSDSVPAMLSNEEFVVNAQAVKQPGVLPLLHAINGSPEHASNAGVARYASGGLVGASGGAAAIGKASGPTIINLLDPSLLGDHLATAKGKDQLVNVMSRDSSTFKGALNL